MRSRDRPRNHGRALCHGANLMATAMKKPEGKTTIHGAGVMVESRAVGAADDGDGMNLAQINLATW